MAFEVFVQVKDVSGGDTYYTVPNDLQTQYRKLHAKVNQIAQKKLSYIVLCGLGVTAGFMTGETALMSGVVINSLEKVLPFFIIGIFAAVICARVIRRKFALYNEAKCELDILTKKIGQEVFKTLWPYQGGQVKHGIRSIHQTEIPPGSPIILVSWEGGPAITLKRVPEPTEHSVSEHEAPEMQLPA